MTVARQAANLLKGSVDIAMIPEIIQVVQELSTTGGAETVALELARAFDRLSLQSCVLTSVAAPEARTLKRVELVAPWLSRIKTRGRMRHLGRVLVVPLFTIASTLASRRHRGAVIISHGDTLQGDILVVHAVNAASLREKRARREWSWIANPIHAWVTVRDFWMIRRLRYRAFVAVSERVATELSDHHGVPRDRIAVIPNGIDLARFRPDPTARESLRREFGIPADAKVLLFVGHEFRRKGLGALLRAHGQLDPDTWVLVVGSDDPAPYRRLGGPAAERVIFAGERRDVPAFYAASDAFVLPTGYETFSLVCMEAMASGLPIFATRVGGIENYLEDGVNGHVISQDADDIARILLPALREDGHLGRLGGNARLTAREFDWGTIAQRYLSLIRTLRPADGTVAR